MASNREKGNNFENELAEKLSVTGWWVHTLQQNKAGQPADLIVCRDSCPVLIDAKVCEKDKFPLSRVEANQESAMALWKARGNGDGYFALKISTGIYMMSFGAFKKFRKNGIKEMNRGMIESLLTLEEWDTW